MAGVTEGVAVTHRLPETFAAVLADYERAYGLRVPVVLVEGEAGVEGFTDAKVGDPRILAVAEKVRYVVDPSLPYPQRFTGHVRGRFMTLTVTLTDTGSLASVAVEDDHARVGQAQRQAEADRRGQAHRMLQVEEALAVAEVVELLRGRAHDRDNEPVAELGVEGSQAVRALHGSVLHELASEEEGDG